jgi:hypothetical protein
MALEDLLPHQIVNKKSDSDMGFKALEFLGSGYLKNRNESRY